LAGDSRVRVLRNDGNPGFAKACNQGAAAGAAAWLAFVNPDCFVEPDSLARLLALMNADAGIGLAGADVVDAAGQREPAARRRDPTLRNTLRAATGDAGAMYLGPDAQHAVQDVDAVSGALMMLPRAAFERVGGFDAGYRLHAEDLDLCRRVREAGLRVVVANGVRVVHLKGTSSRARPLFVAWHKHRGLARYWRRFGAGTGAPGNTLAIVAVWLRFAALLPVLLLRSLQARGRST
jgi:GT2 family glycosyltransferase